MVQAVRVGTIFARDQKAYNRWRSKPSRRTASLSGAALERAVMDVARMFPQNVVAA